MLCDEQKRELIERQIDGILTAKEQQLYGQLLREDENFAQEVNFHKKFMNSMNRLGDELFLSNLQNLEQQLQTERTAKNNSANSLKNLTDKVLQKGNELLDQLAAAFLPIPQYETILASISRSDSIEVIESKNGLDCKEGLLQFELKKRIDQNFQFSIEDNRQTILIEQTIPTHTQEFEVDIKDLKAGRYYWKLKAAEDLAMGSFFIRKDLMAIN